jgi:hypothetical protein
MVAGGGIELPTCGLRGQLAGMIYLFLTKFIHLERPRRRASLSQAIRIIVFKGDL